MFTSRSFRGRPTLPGRQFSFAPPPPPRAPSAQQMISDQLTQQRITPGALGASQGGQGLTPAADWAKMFPHGPTADQVRAAQPPGNGGPAPMQGPPSPQQIDAQLANAQTPAGVPFRGSTPAEVGDFYKSATPPAGSAPGRSGQPAPDNSPAPPATPSADPTAETPSDARGYIPKGFMRGKQWAFDVTPNMASGYPRGATVRGRGRMPHYAAGGPAAPGAAPDPALLQQEANQSQADQFARNEASITGAGSPMNALSGADNFASGMVPRGDGRGRMPHYAAGGPAAPGAAPDPALLQQEANQRQADQFARDEASITNTNTNGSFSAGGGEDAFARGYIPKGFKRGKQWAFDVTSNMASGYPPGAAMRGRGRMPGYAAGMPPASGATPDPALLQQEANQRQADQFARNEASITDLRTPYSAGGGTDAFARGYLPKELAAMERERAAIKRGVGGARPGDEPRVVNLRGVGRAVINTGERVVRSGGKDAVLTRRMQARGWRKK